MSEFLGPVTRRRLRIAGVAIATVAVVMLLNAVTGANAQEDSGATESSDVIQRGRDLFGARCALCHGELGRGTEDGPSLIGAGPAAVDFYIRTGRMPLRQAGEAVYHREQRLTDEERDALVAYIPTLSPADQQGPDIPSVDDWESADLSRGLDLFVSNCAACHGPTAAGIAVGQEDFSSSLDVATPVEIAEAIRIGPGVMPVFGPDVLPGEDMEAVVAWVMNLRQREAPGGAQIGRSGPVSEGFVAWIVGLGLLGIVMYLLGERTGDEADGEV